MNKKLWVVLMLTWSGAAFAQAGKACIFSPAELSATLGHTPEAGAAFKDMLGMQRCRYGMKNARGINFGVIVRKCDQQRFEIHARMIQSTSGKANIPLNGIGDGAYFSPGGGSAAARVREQCIELSGLRAGAKRVVTKADAEKLLTLAVSRIGK